ncbi:helicase HerA-like domain-containing protein [Flavobacterium sp. JP2137]|uniref:helicase HerA-like domain-containing protein n=1 Tax=Flavobacterium sp. JP2137 TaxID=3414510 RepID=UPI003D2FD19A
MKNKNFIDQIESGYTFKGDSITIGGAVLENEVIPDFFVRLPLKTLNRHGLISGATGTGKTKTIQVLSEQLSAKGIPVLMMDVKGDFSGIAAAGSTSAFIEERHGKMNLPYRTQAFPVELLTLSQQKGVPLRATISEFGPVLFSRILELNDTQGGVVSLVFKYCDDNNLLLLDLKDFKKALQYLTNEGKKEIESEYGKISTASSGTILRKIVELEQQGAELFFGETAFDIDDLMRLNEQGQAYINILRINDIQDKPKLFSTFMLNLLAQVYAQMPEQGDSNQPELVIFIDEAHLIFDNASKTLLQQIETIVKLIRSKGIGIFFITQNPIDIPNSVLAQLGLKIQHALRAFTEKDRKALKAASENFPISDFYQTSELLSALPTGEALVTALNEKGIPTPLVQCMLRAPMSRMDILSEAEISAIAQQSALVNKYSAVIDRESAYELLTAKIAHIGQQQEQEAAPKPRTSSTRTPKSGDPLKPLVKVLTSATFIRGAFGILSKIFTANSKK